MLVAMDGNVVFGHIASINRSSTSTGQLLPKIERFRKTSVA
jgi:hypothetical protein